MTYFKLPDLGEGLPEAEIIKWHVSVGDNVEVDQLLVEMETAKAIVEIPSPQKGKIIKLFGQDGDTVHTGEPLVEFESENKSESGTVVGKLEEAKQDDSEDWFIVGAPESSKKALHGNASPIMRALANHLNVDVSKISGSLLDGVKSIDVKKNVKIEAPCDIEGVEILKGVRKTMAKVMAKSHTEVVPVTLFGDADITDWSSDSDVTIRLIKAIAIACKTSPDLNGWFYGDTLSRKLSDSVDIGIATDTEEGLFVPIIKDVFGRDELELRNELNEVKSSIKDRSISPDSMKGATITLSNFGTLAGKYATPVVVPPQIAIVGVGKLSNKLCSVSEDDFGTVDEIMSRKMLPISLTFDHRAATGGEAARFLKSLIKALEKGV